MRKRRFIDKERLSNLYLIQKLSTYQIADILETVPSLIRNNLIKHNIAIRNKSQARKGRGNPWIKKGKENHNWTGGIQKFGHGYFGAYCPYHPNVIGKRVALHRLVMEAHLNRVSLKLWLSYGINNCYPKGVRFLQRSEVVHHIDGNKHNNKLKNLMLFASVREHNLFNHLGNHNFICKFCLKDQRCS